MSKRFVILGGGTAGWITAHQIKSFIPEANVTLIQNESIGVIGVGEATVPNIKTFLDQSNIPYEKVFREANATIKNGINFENWNGDGKRYFHGFYEALTDFKIGNAFDSDTFDSDVDRFFVRYQTPGRS